MGLCCVDPCLENVPLFTSQGFYVRGKPDNDEKSKILFSEILSENEMIPKRFLTRLVLLEDAG